MVVRFAMVVALVLLAGCTDFDAQNVQSSDLRILSIDVAAPTVSTGALQLLVNITLDNGAGASGPVDLVVKAFDESTGLLVLTRGAHPDKLPAHSTRSIPVPLDLPRAAAYRAEVDVYEEGRLVVVQAVSASNLEALAPNLHSTGLAITAIDFHVADTKTGRATIRATAELTNEGRAPTALLRIQLKAREVTTSLIADEKWADVPQVAVDATQPVAVDLNVPDGYNYAVDAVLWDGGVIVERGTGNVQLAPQATLPSGQEIVVTHPDITAFRNAPQAADDRAQAGSGASRSSATPAPGIAVGVVALLGAVLLLRRRSFA